MIVNISCYFPLKFLDNVTLLIKSHFFKILKGKSIFGNMSLLPMRIYQFPACWWHCRVTLLNLNVNQFSTSFNLWYCNIVPVYTLCAFNIAVYIFMYKRSIFYIGFYRCLQFIRGNILGQDLWSNQIHLNGIFYKVG